MNMNYNEIQEKLDALHKLLLSLNAYGSLDLDDLKILEAYLKGAFDFDVKMLDCDAPGR